MLPDFAAIFVTPYSYRKTFFPNVLTGARSEIREQEDFANARVTEHLILTSSLGSQSEPPNLSGVWDE